MKKVKISELPLYTTLKGLFTIGTDKDNRSVKVSLEFIESATQNAQTAASEAQHVKSETEKAMLNAQKATSAANAAADYAIDAAGRTLAPLPFMFGEIDDIPMSGLPVFDREQGRFFRPNENRDAIEIDPADGPYNIYAADGRVIANTDRLFICGHTVYRYTGRELVNVAIEQNPNQRLVSRTPSVNAHPGLVYLDRGFIRLPIHSGENRVSLEGLYCKFGIEHIVPLAEAVTGVEVYDAAGEEVNAEIIGNCVVFNIGEIDPNRAGLVMARLSIDSDGGMCEGNNTAFIGVRYDADNHKIFYQTSARPVPETVQPPTLREAREYTGMEMRGANACFVSGQRRGFLTELWLKRRHGTGSKTRRVGLGLPKKWRHLRNERQWRWRRCKDMLINRNSFLMRMRRVCGNRRSEWAYFHVDLRRFKLSGGRSDITIRPARQVRT